MNKLLGRTAAAALLAATCLTAQATQNPVFRANRTFYTSMWTANPPEYTTAGQSVAAGTMHWRVFPERGLVRGEPRSITGIGCWWQPSDVSGTFPQNIATPELRFYGTTTDAQNLEVPDLANPMLASVAPMTMPVNSGSAFNSLTISLSNPIATTRNDLALCGVYPASASSTTAGFFGFLPSAANQAQGLAQSYYGFAYPNGTLTHFSLGGARSSLWFYESQPTISLRGNWALSDSHFGQGYINGAWGDSSYFAPFADANWAGWTDSRNPAVLGITVFADGFDGYQPVLLMNAGPRFPASIPILGITLELNPADSTLGTLVNLGMPINNERFDVDIPIMTAPDPTAMGFWLGFEALILDPVTLQFVDSTQAVWTQS